MLHRLLDRLLVSVLRASWTASQRLSVSVPRKVEDLRLQIPLMYGVGFQNLAIAPQDRPLAQAVRAVLGCRDGGIIDIGCNIGHFLQLCLLADRSRPYAGFDPSLACSFYTQRFIIDNQLPCHYVFPIGLGERPALVELQSNGPFDVCASFSRKAHFPGRFRYTMPMWIECGDDVVLKLPFERIALIKIDVEGLELEVLRGLERTIGSERPFVIFEVLHYATLGSRPETGAGCDPGVLRAVADYRRQHAVEMGRYFRSRGYLIFRLQRSGGFAEVEDLDPRDGTDPVEMDHLAVPQEYAKSFLELRSGGRPAPTRRAA